MSNLRESIHRAAIAALPESRALDGNGRMRIQSDHDVAELVPNRANKARQTQHVFARARNVQRALLIAEVVLGIDDQQRVHVRSLRRKVCLPWQLSSRWFPYPRSRE